jgi:hypothetical protein
LATADTEQLTVMLVKSSGVVCDDHRVIFLLG